MVGVIDSVPQQKLADLQRLADRLKLLSTHDGFFLLKNCFSLPKLMYTLRSAPCYDSPFIRQYDNLIRNTLQSILNVTLSDDAWSQSKLPVKLGGLGVLSASDIAVPAFIASVIGSADLALKVLPSSLAGNTGSNDADYIRYVSLWQ